MNKPLNTYRVEVESQRGIRETFTISATYAKAAEFDAKIEAQRAYPFSGAFDVVRVEQVQR